jgi:hypothetical protein
MQGIVFLFSLIYSSYYPELAFLRIGMRDHGFVHTSETVNQSNFVTLSKPEYPYAVPRFIRRQGGQTGLYIRTIKDMHNSIILFGAVGK